MQTVHTVHTVRTQGEGGAGNGLRFITRSSPIDDFFSADVLTACGLPTGFERIDDVIERHQQRECRSVVSGLLDAIEAAFVPADADQVGTHERTGKHGRPRFPCCRLPRAPPVPQHSVCVSHSYASCRSDYLFIYTHIA
jgi:hypothetical protein